MLLDAAQTCLLLVPEGMEGIAVLPESLAAVPACVITRCIKLSGLSFPAGSTLDASLVTRNGILYSKNINSAGATDGTLTLLAVPAGIGTSVVIDANCTAIAEGAFWGCPNLATIVAGGNVGSIFSPQGGENGEGGEGAKTGGTSETGEGIPAFNSQTIENANVALGVSADNFESAAAAWRAAGFTKFTEPAQPGDTIVPEDGQSGFAFTMLPDYTLSVGWVGESKPDAAMQVPEYGILNGVEYTVSAVQNAAFQGCENLVTVNLPATVTSIGASAFENCASLATVQFPGGLSSIGANAFANTGLCSVVLPTGLETVGSQAFAGLADTVIVALNNNAKDVAADALAGCRNVSVYVPHSTTGEYAWKTGLTASGNHLYPYGVKFSDSLSNLAVGDQLPMFGEDGYFEAPGNIEVAFSYKAAAISIDTENYTVSAKREGEWRIDIDLRLQVPEVVAGQQQMRNLQLSPAALRMGQDATRAAAPAPTFSTVQRQLKNLGAAQETGTYSVGGTVRSAAQITVAVPMRAVFDTTATSTNGYDVNANTDTEGAVLVANCYFENRSTDGQSVQLTNVKCEGTDEGVGAILQPRTGTALNQTEMFGLRTADSTTDAITFGYGDTVNSKPVTAGSFVVPSGENNKLDVQFTLDLATKTKLTEPFKSGIDAHTTEHDIVKVIYTFQADSSIG
ncbi:leucine-rich repeat domain-containing protein [Adlercreutzia sp. ZJ154]|uniref:leucine-rich repeat domain-containing protein n=1 Tax=Adlercreutzia sp. ZJ154 TaxID=2709790 RepID=UPI0013EDD1C1|nr:leucine-rich repeat domain-containing protein [Adlercreutzia sp. ZJ154]